MRFPAIVLVASLCLAGEASAAEGAVPYETADTWISAHSDELRALNQSIWSHPELGLAEVHASGELIGYLERAGFKVERGVAGMPTAFVATAGQGRPIIGILAEYDALPGMSQAAEPTRKARAGAPSGSDRDIGHACGHSIFGTASTAAAAAAWYAMGETGMQGTIRLYGTPAEETGIGKVYMSRAGLFADLDAALHWHAGDRTRASYGSTKAVVSVKFRFEGLAAHASKSPHEGRSALDAVELMNIGANYLREHIKDDARVHYVITEGGGQPNVVPPRAEVWYFLRADHHRDVERILERVREIARGAAQMTRTTVSDRVDADTFEILPNRPLSELLQRHLERVGPPRFDEKELAFARQTQSELPDPPEQSLASDLDPLPPDPLQGAASSDVGNVSWSVPTSGMRVASYTLGAPGHSWQIVACTGMSIGEKGMIVATRALAGAALELLARPEEIQKARADFERRRAELPAPQYVIPDGQGPPATIR